MASHTFYQELGDLEKGVVRLFAEVAITDASGTPSLTRGKGIKSITRSSAGKYVVTLLQDYNRLLSLAVSAKKNAGITATPGFCQTADDTVQSTKTITFTMLAPAGSALDPSNTEVLYIEMALSNSIAP